MFDPFNDYDDVGYLRNNLKEKDIFLVKKLEHDSYNANLDEAISYSIDQDYLNYEHFLNVHKILFSDLYPWAGQDRFEIAKNIAVSKANIFFSHPFDIRLAVNEGLNISQTKNQMDYRLGEVMGLFAYGHPFLDGNGRTMLIIHSTLCYKAGFSIDWKKTNKNDYLKLLSQEIENPAKGILDNYLLKFKTDPLNLKEIHNQLSTINGLDGLDDNNEENDINNKNIIKSYQQFENKRNYKIQNKSDYRKN